MSMLLCAHVASVVEAEALAQLVHVVASGLDQIDARHVRAVVALLAYSLPS